MLKKDLASSLQGRLGHKQYFILIYRLIIFIILKLILR